MQVFTDIAGLSHAVTPSSDARVEFMFNGTDLFEMEDQRQWLDGNSPSIVVKQVLIVQRGRD